MNFIDAAGVLADSAQLLLNDKMAHEARQVVHDVVADYDALAPKPEEWPDGAQWYAIDASEESAFFSEEPKMYSNSWWHESAWPYGYGKSLPLGIDWRLCIWQRPEEAQ